MDEETDGENEVKNNNKTDKKKIYINKKNNTENKTENKQEDTEENKYIPETKNLSENDYLFENRLNRNREIVYVGDTVGALMKFDIRRTYKPTLHERAASLAASQQPEDVLSRRKNRAIMRRYERSKLKKEKLINDMEGNENKNILKNIYKDNINISCKLMGVCHGIMGSLKHLSIHEDGAHIVGVGSGRKACVYDSRNRKIVREVYLTQKLTSCIVSSEPM
eukprot:GHVR01147153.1.p1 GENE.GHVR01147153.1~~GHVR01147153.1.p1  ORF type:complete len:245 (+),score=84.59 GHVR01147153.1:70-735(+)